MMKRLIFSLTLLASVVVLTSCSGDDYINSIPSRSTAIVKIDASQMYSGEEKSKLAQTVADVLGVENLSDCGLNTSKAIYLFESPDGNIGFSAEVSDKDKAEEWLKKLAEKHICQLPIERRDNVFTILKGAWVVGVSSSTILIMGPSTATAQAELMRTEMRLLSQDEEDGAKNSPLFTKLETLKSAVALVAQADALPESFVAPFVLGAPKDASPSDVIIAATIESAKNNILRIEGDTYSDNPQINKSLQSARNDYRPIKGEFLSSMSDDATLGLFMNVDGSKFIKLMQQDKMLLQLMSGINTVIDINKIVNSVDGDMTVIVPSYSDSNLQLMWGADLRDSKFLNDVDYWKKSVPSGGKLTDAGPNFYAYTDGKMSFYFGVSPNMKFYSGSSDAQAKSLLKPSAVQMPAEVASLVKGKKVGAVIKLNSLTGNNDTMVMVQTFLKPLFGNVDYVVYTMK